MKKIGMVLARMALLIVAQPLVGTVGGMSGMSTGSYGNNDSAMKDTHQMMSVQATEEQPEHLRGVDTDYGRFEPTAG